jgi:hypothetical protein
MPKKTCGTSFRNFIGSVTFAIAGVAVAHRSRSILPEAESRIGCGLPHRVFRAEVGHVLSWESTWAWW